jgi:pilus assembly protein CpaE
MTLLLEADSQLAALLAPVLAGEVTVVDAIPELHRQLQDLPDIDVVVVGPDVDLAVTLAFAAGQRIARPTLGVVLLRRRVDTAVLTQALRAGIREVVGVDDLAAVAEACARSREVSRSLRGGVAEGQSGEGGMVVTVFSAKGGCGKTTVSTNLAAAAAAGGARRVCLLDLDLAFGDVAIAMQLFPARTIADAVGLSSALDESAVRSIVTPHSPNLDTIVAPVEPGTADSIPASVVTELLRVLRTMYDLVVIDTPPAFTDHVLAAFDNSDLYVLLATLDVPAVKNLKLTLETLTMLGYPREKWRLALNRSDSKVGLSLGDVEKTLKAKIAVEIPSSRDVSASVNRGVPLVLDAPNHPVSEAIHRFIKAELPLGAGVPAGLRQDRRGFGLLRRGGETG